MVEILSFPKMGLELTLNRIAFSIGNIDIYWYAIIIMSGVVLSLLVAMKISSKFGLYANKVIDVIMISLGGSVIFARAYYVIFQWDYYEDNLLEIFNIRGGGLAIYGGIIGAFIVGLITAKIMKVKFLPLADIISIGFLLGQGIGRWGNFVNIEAFGGNTSLPWGMHSNSIQTYLESQQNLLESFGIFVDPTMPVHPTFFYESIWCLIGFIGLLFYIKHRKFDGEIFLIYIIWYGFGRSIIEGFRTDSLMIGNFRISQILGILFCIIGIYILIKLKKKVSNDKECSLSKLYVDTEESKIVVSGKFYEKNQEISEKKSNNTDTSNSIDKKDI
ncbi:MAG: prolipoprotein diacylglyceryl transferase [Oscillospiraceae bacterium]|nr:prolipoprotein diacylglyceryl transferase [Oscillospiraceae bacterium]